VVHIKFFKPGEPIETFCKAVVDDVIPAWDDLRTNARDVAEKVEATTGISCTLRSAGPDWTFFLVPTHINVPVDELVAALPRAKGQPHSIHEVPQ